MNILSSIPMLKNIVVFSMVPLVYMSLMIMLPAFTGVIITTGELPLEDVKILEEPDRTLISDTYIVLFYIYPIYLLGELLLFILILILMLCKFTLDEKEKKQKGFTKTCYGCLDTYRIPEYVELFLCPKCKEKK